MSISNTFVNKVDLIFTHTIDLNYYKKTALTTSGNNPINTFLSLKNIDLRFKNNANNSQYNQ